MGQTQTLSPITQYLNNDLLSKGDFKMGIRFHYENIQIGINIFIWFIDIS